MKTTILSMARLSQTAPLYDLRVRRPADMPRPEPGQFAHILCGEQFTLRRPISIADYDEKDDSLRFCFEIRGKGTSALSLLCAGDTVDLLAPLGNGFSPDPSLGRVLLIGGGIGVYPLLFAAHRLGSNAKALLGFRTESLISGVKELEEMGCAVEVITDDGSNGRKGFVTDLLLEEIEKDRPGQILTCGPAPMMASVAKIALRAGIPCEVSLEERMACGVGACMGCACKIRDLSSDDPDAFCYKRVCADGPVFSAKEVIW